jgi:CO/xanthine dehydrogenase FAD-binding subunit
MEAGFEPQEGADEGKYIAYYAPMTLGEAENLKRKAKGSHYFAGGTMLNWKGSHPGKGLIDLKNLHLDTIEVTPSKIVIGATVTIQDIADHQHLPEALTKAANLFTSRNIRNMATAGGTATGSFFVSDVLPVFVAFNADIEYFHNWSRRILPVSLWLKERSGLICSIIINNVKRKVKLQQEKISKMDFPLIVTSVGLELVENTVKDPVVAISGASGKIVISESGAEYLSGKQLADIDVEELNNAVQKDVQPTGNVKATPRVKRRIIESHLKEIVTELKKEEKS